MTAVVLRAAAAGAGGAARRRCATGCRWWCQAAVGVGRWAATASKTCGAVACRGGGGGCHRRRIEEAGSGRKKEGGGVSGPKAKINVLPCEQDDDSQGGERDIQMPNLPERLRYLEVFCCENLRVIDKKAPNISSFLYSGERIQLSLGDTLKMEYIHLTFGRALHYACVELPSSMPNLKIANINSANEMANTPVLRRKFLHLKKLIIRPRTITFSYDYFSLVSLIDACPSLETLILDVSQEKMEHVSIFTDPSDLRKGQQHHKMKRVKILGFTSAKSLVELTCHFLEHDIT
ncbi:hypothetical protein PR202_ga11350 [Eleusine coracana subsp. coracana]|uniref:At1g61320/AtMIF1 LRR domain-containing protein n=1 Tax=Eleusine coracana subsp. coracana TaxID=191504 RepID=A0AAV5C957_ELECO|nr:hypothetical protein PR202_ga11350 [Eleusine coracana subsp. coracana]